MQILEQLLYHKKYLFSISALMNSRYLFLTTV